MGECISQYERYGCRGIMNVFIFVLKSVNDNKITNIMTLDLFSSDSVLARCNLHPLDSSTHHLDALCKLSSAVSLISYTRMLPLEPGA